MVKINLPSAVKFGLAKKSHSIPRGIRREIEIENKGRATTRYITKQMLDVIGIKDKKKRQAVQTAVTQHYREIIMIDAEKERMSEKERFDAIGKIDNKLTVSLKNLLGEDFIRFEKVRQRIISGGK